MIARPHRLAWWAGWDYGTVSHAWKYNRVNNDYVDSACGMTAHKRRLINNQSKHCKNCERLRNK